MGGRRNVCAVCEVCEVWVDRWAEEWVDGGMGEGMGLRVCVFITAGLVSLI
jgi:hypothetical protein